MSPSRRPYIRSMNTVAATAIAAVALAGCAGSPADTADATGSAEAADGFTFMFPQIADDGDYYTKISEQYMDETGVDIELLPYPGDAYDSQLRTQLQAGNAADLMIVAPGTGQIRSALDLVDAGFLAPLNDTSASVIPAGTEDLYSVDGDVYAQPTGLVPVGLVYNPDAAADAGIDEYPADFDELLEACGTARDSGKVFTALAGSIPTNPGLLIQIMAATRVYEETPDWNDQRAAGDVTFADSGWRDALEAFVEMNDAGCFQDGAAGAGFDAITGGIVGGTVLTAGLPGNAAASLGAASGGAPIEVRNFPADGQEDWIIASATYAWGVNAKASGETQAAAQEFLDWLAQPEIGEEFATLAGLLPIGGGGEPLPQYAPVATLIESGSITALPAATWPNATVFDALATGAQGLLTGQSTVDGILEAMDAAWDA